MEFLGGICACSFQMTIVVRGIYSYALQVKIIAEILRKRCIWRSYLFLLIQVESVMLVTENDKVQLN